MDNREKKYFVRRQSASMENSPRNVQDPRFVIAQVKKKQLFSTVIAYLLHLSIGLIFFVKAHLLRLLIVIQANLDTTNPHVTNTSILRTVFCLPVQL